MIDAERFLAAARAHGLDFVTGVPCSFLTPLINRAISDPANAYVGAASEGEAVAVAAGAWLAGRKAMVILQNSGLGNAVNPLTSLNHPFRIPTLLVVTWRGRPGLKDEPQHEVMGEITPALLDVIRVPHRLFPEEDSAIAPALTEAAGAMDRDRLPFAFVMPKGAVRQEGLRQPPPAGRERGVRLGLEAGGQRPSRARVLERTLALLPERAAVIASTGKCGRELFTLDDRPQHLYLVGSMGCAGAVGLGVALNARRPVVVLDGDGGALMKLGTLATIGAEAPRNLVHVVLDNGVHDSTGGQRTVSANVDFAAAALACGYGFAASCDDLQGFENALTSALGRQGPCLIHARIEPGSLAELGRPTVSPRDVADRFRRFLQQSAPHGANPEPESIVAP